MVGGLAWVRGGVYGRRRGWEAQQSDEMVLRVAGRLVVVGELADWWMVLGGFGRMLLLV